MTTAQRERLEAHIRDACNARDYGMAMTWIVDGYGHELLGFLAGRLRRDDAAAEVYAMTLEKAWKGLPDFQGTSSARGWMYAIARNALIDHVRGERRHAADATVGDLGPVSALVQRARTHTATFRRTETKDRFRALRDQLNDDDQTLLILRVDRQLSWLDLAAVMAPEDDPRTASARMRQRFSAVKKRLKRLATEEGLL